MASSQVSPPLSLCEKVRVSGGVHACAQLFRGLTSPGGGTDESALPPDFMLGKSSRGAARGRLADRPALLPCSVYETSAPGADNGSLPLVAAAGRDATVSQAVGVFVSRSEIGSVIAHKLWAVVAGSVFRQAQEANRCSGSGGVCSGPLCREPDNSILFHQV